MASITGKMAATSRVASSTASEMEREFGKEELETATAMTVAIETTKNGATGFLHGPVEMSTRETMKQT